jgi:CRP-like cAMP-binding protein
MMLAMNPIDVAEPRWMGAADLGQLRHLGTRRALPAGSTLFVEGDEPYDLMIIETGDVKLVTTALNGQETVLDVLGAGEVLGELSAIDGAPRSATAVALTAVELTSISVDRFLVFLRANPSLMGALLAVTVRRLRLSNRRQLEFTTADALGRVCARLDELADRYGRDGDRAADGIQIELPITQTELAQWCGLSREAVVKALRKLRDLGWISITDREVSVLDRSKVRNRARL